MSSDAFQRVSFQTGKEILGSEYMQDQLRLSADEYERLGYDDAAEAIREVSRVIRRAELDVERMLGVEQHAEDNPATVRFILKHVERYASGNCSDEELMERVNEWQREATP